MRWLRWLVPGLRVKRWFALFAAGILVFATGWAIVVDRPPLAALDTMVRRGVMALTGSHLPARVGGMILAGLGVAAVLAAMHGAYRSVTSALVPPERAGDLIVQRRRADSGPRIVALGGGTGLSTLVRGLKAYTSRVTAVVAVTDDGGSSGRLVGELGMLPPGDIRNVLIALADMEPLMERLLQHRFSRGTLAGHSLGNLLIGALTEVLGDFEEAVRQSSRVLAVRGQVLPSTAQPVRLCAELDDGEVVRGETRISSSGRPIRRVFLEPAGAVPPAAALEAVAEADMIVLGPGSLFTSVLPNLLIAPLREAIRASKALKVYVVNVMTQPGETDGFSAADHVRALLEHTGPGIVDLVLVNTGPVDPARLEQYRARGADVVRADRAELARLGVQVVAAPVVAAGDLVRHDSRLLAAEVMRLLLDYGPTRRGRFFHHLWLSERLRWATRNAHGSSAAAGSGRQPPGSGA